MGRVAPTRADDDDKAYAFLQSRRSAAKREKRVGRPTSAAEPARDRPADP